MGGSQKRSADAAGLEDVNVKAAEEEDSEVEEVEEEEGSEVEEEATPVFGGKAKMTPAMIEAEAQTAADRDIAGRLQAEADAALYEQHAAEEAASVAEVPDAPAALEKEAATQEAVSEAASLSLAEKLQADEKAACEQRAAAEAKKMVTAVHAQACTEAAAAKEEAKIAAKKAAEAEAKAAAATAKEAEAKAAVEQEIVTFLTDYVKTVDLSTVTITMVKKEIAEKIGAEPTTHYSDEIVERFLSESFSKTTGGMPTEARVSKRELHALLTTSGPHLRYYVGDKVMGKWGGVRGGLRWLPAVVIAVGAQHFDLKYDDDGQIEYNVRNPSQPLGPNPGSDHYSDHYPGPD